MTPDIIFLAELKKGEPIGEVIGLTSEYNKGDPRIPIVMWADNYIPEIGSSLYLSPVIPEGWKEFLEMWVYDGALQTFESREKFRKEAKDLLAAIEREKQ